MKVGCSFLILVLVILITASWIYPRAILDFDGDGKTDLVTRRNVNQRMYWFAKLSSGGDFVEQWGASSTPSESVFFSDFPICEDYDGDGKWDIAVWRINYNTEMQTYFYIYYSETNTFEVVPWGIRGDFPIPKDFDGDGKADIAVFRNSNGTWYILQSRDGLRIQRFGQGGDYPLRGDYDGDGKDDIALARPMGNNPDKEFVFHILRSSDGQWTAERFGTEIRDYPAPGDYDGDGKTDISVWRGRSEFGDGTWYWHRSSDGQYEQVQWGGQVTSDNPVQGDYDGDGKTDPAVWRQFPFGTQQAYFIIKQSRDGIRYEPWGLSTDGTGRLW